VTALAPLSRKARSERITTTLHPDEFPDVYSMQCDGTCMQPVIMDGCHLMFDKREVPRPGDFVAVIRALDFLPPGEHQIIVKRLVIATAGPAYWRPGWINSNDLAPVVVVESLNPRKRYSFHPSHLLGMHKCMGVTPREKIGPPLSDEEVRRANRTKGLH